jgi:hypothetical protein
MNKQDSGNVAFFAMVVVLAYLLVVCVVCPLVIANFSKQPYALPLMASGLALPFLHFFIFGGITAAGLNKDKKGKE